MNNKEQLASDLFKSFEDFQSNAPTPGGSREANLYVASKLADAIWDGIERGSRLVFKGSKTSEELNGISEKIDGDVYLCTTDGVLEGSVPLDVSANTAVIWDGKSWSKFIEIDLSEYYTKIETDANLTAAVANEAGLRDAADTALGERIDAEATARANADTTLQGNIDAEANARESADDALDARIDGEETAREQADSELQAQIDAISSRSDVVNVVASYAELVAYDTSTLADNDVIKVLADETHDDAIAYYRWSTTTEAWSFVGSQGPYYTISETDTLLADKVDKVAGKGLSTNDYTTDEKNKLAGIEAGADKSLVKFLSFTTNYSNLVEAFGNGYRIFLTGVITGEYPLIYSMVTFDRTNEEMVFAAVRDGGTLCTITKASRYGTAFLARDYTLAPQSHASSDTTYGKGTSSNYGHVKLSSDTSSTSGVNDGVAATPSAVKSAYDLANSKYSKPSGGVPYSDMSSGVKASLDKADSALQQQSLAGYVNGVTVDSTTSFGDSSTIVIGKSGKNLLTRTASALWTYIKGKADSVYAALSHTHSVKINGTTKTIAASGGTAVDLGTYLTSQDISGKENTSNKVSSWSSTTTNAHYPSEKLVKDSLDVKANADGSNATGTWEALSRGVSGNYLDVSGTLVRLGTLTSSGQSVSFSLLISIHTNAGYPRKALYLASVSWRPNQDRANLSLVCLSTTPSNFSKTTWGKCTLGINNVVSGAGLYLLVETQVSNLRMTCAMLHTGNSGGFSVKLQNIDAPVTLGMSADEVGAAFVPYNTAVGSASQPVYSNSAGELKPCDLIINKGSHPTVTLDFSGTLGSGADVIYFV